MALRSFFIVEAEVGIEPAQLDLQSTYKATHFNRLALYTLRKLLIFHALSAEQFEERC